MWAWVLLVSAVIGGVRRRRGDASPDQFARCRTGTCLFEPQLLQLLGQLCDL